MQLFYNTLWNYFASAQYITKACSNMFHLAQLTSVPCVGTKTWLILSVVIVRATTMGSCCYCWDNNYSKCCYWRTKHDHRVMLLSDKNIPIECCYCREMLPSFVIVWTRIVTKFRCCRDKKHGQVLLLWDNNHGHVLL